MAWIGKGTFAEMLLMTLVSHLLLKRGGDLI